MLIENQKLPCIQKKLIRSVPVQGIFEATALNGFYTFTGTAPVNLIGLNPDSSYYMHEVSYILDIDKNVFLDALFEPITCSLFTSMNRTPIFQGALPVGAYDNVWVTETFFKSDRKPQGFGPNQFQEYLTGRIDGALQQTPELIALGKPKVKLFLSIGLLEVAFKDSIREWGVF